MRTRLYDMLAASTLGMINTFAGPGKPEFAPGPVARWRATEPQNGARWSFASRSLQPRRPANGWRALACRRSFWRCSARSRGTRPRSSEPERGTVVSVQAAAALMALPRPAAPQVGSPAQQAPAAADPVAAAVDRVAVDPAAAVDRVAAGGVIDVGFSGGHDFAAQDSILTRPFA
jgi:hypothetical protein